MHVSTSELDCSNATLRTLIYVVFVLIKKLRACVVDRPRLKCDSIWQHVFDMNENTNVRHRQRDSRVIAVYVESGTHYAAKFLIV